MPMYSNSIGRSKIFPPSAPDLHWLSHLTCISSLKVKNERKTLIFTQLKISSDLFTVVLPQTPGCHPTESDSILDACCAGRGDCVSSRNPIASRFACAPFFFLSFFFFSSSFFKVKLYCFLKQSGAQFQAMFCFVL